MIYNIISWWAYFDGQGPWRKRYLDGHCPSRKQFIKPNLFLLNTVAVGQKKAFETFLDFSIQLLFNPLSSTEIFVDFSTLLLFNPATVNGKIFFFCRNSIAINQNFSDISILLLLNWKLHWIFHSFSPFSLGYSSSLFQPTFPF